MTEKVFSKDKQTVKKIIIEKNEPVNCIATHFYGIPNFLIRFVYRKPY